MLTSSTCTLYFLLVGSQNSDTEAPRQRYQSLTIPTSFSTEKTAFPIQSPFVCVALPTCLSVVKPVVLCIRLEVYSRGRQNYVTGHKWPVGVRIGHGCFYTQQNHYLSCLSCSSTATTCTCIYTVPTYTLYLHLRNHLQVTAFTRI